jgi:FkbM family methyltransferase
MAADTHAAAAARRARAARRRQTVGLAIHRTLRRFGIDVVRYDAASSLDAARTRVLREHGIAVVLDVGANAGYYAEGLRSLGHRGRIVSFEPLPGAYAELADRAQGDPLWETRQLALADDDGSTTINVAANSWSSSLLPMTERHLAAAPGSEYVGNEVVETARLDALDGLVRPGERALLKVDVQGAELKVLAGAERTLESVDAVEAEVSLVPLYDGQPLAAEVMQALHDLDFRPIWLERGFVDRRSGHVLSLDALFVRT